MELFIILATVMQAVLLVGTTTASSGDGGSDTGAS